MYKLKLHNFERTVSLCVSSHGFELLRKNIRQSNDVILLISEYKNIIVF
jgi:hypothetical protein